MSTFKEINILNAMLEAGLTAEDKALQMFFSYAWGKAWVLSLRYCYLMVWGYEHGLLTEDLITPKEVAYYRKRIQSAECE